MNSRSKRMLALLKNDYESTDENRRILSNNNNSKEETEEQITHDTAEQIYCVSPLPPEALEILSTQQMQDVWNDAFSENGTQEPPVKSTYHQDESFAKVSVPEQTEDPFMPVGEMTPIGLNDFSQSETSHVSCNITTPTPLTPIFSALTSSPITEIIEDSSQVSVSNTPVASPVNKHAKCDDPFCCQHEIDDFSCPSVSTIGTNSNQPSPSCSTFLKNRGKKRTRKYDDWGEIKRKNLKIQGKAYVSKRGRIVDAKTMGPPCKCKFHCSTKISKEERLETFTKFWELASTEKQWLYVANYTKKQPKNRTFRRQLKHNRVFTYKYYLPKKTDETTIFDKIDVCKTMFLNTLGISERTARTAWRKHDGNSDVEQDMRGRHNNHKTVIDDEMMLSVCAHVNSFVPIESHYCRKESKRLYLDGSLSVARMFQMYKDWPDLDKYSKIAKTLRQYRDIVNSQFNLSFHIPKKDTCDQCHIFKQTENPSEEFKEQHKKHQTHKTIARQLKNSDKNEAILSNGRILCATFDFQKVLSCPHGQISILYYKRKLSCYNFTIFDVSTKKGYCYVWDESVAKRGSNEVASCLYDFVKDSFEKGVKDFRFWSDNCAGQNKNRILFAFYTYVAKNLGVTITHRFLEKGHTQNEGDCVHSVIERAGEHKVIYTPEEWKLLIKWAKSENPYEVRDLTREQVYDFKDLLKKRNWTKNTLNEKNMWTKIREVVIEESQPHKIQYKYNLQDDSMTLVIRKETRNVMHIENILQNAYLGPLSISKDKYKDLISLCETGIIPAKYHTYFKSLPHSLSDATGDADNTNDDDNC